MMLRKPSSSHHVWLRRSYISLSTGIGPSPRTNADRSNRIRPPPPAASAAPPVPPTSRRTSGGAPPHLAYDLPLSWLGSAPPLAEPLRKGLATMPLCHCDKRGSSSAVRSGTSCAADVVAMRR